MSITFSIQDAPMEQVAPYADEPDYFESRPVAPFTEINLSNGSAFEVLKVLDPAVAPDWCGEWGQDKLRAIQKRLMVLLNTEKKAVLEAPPYSEGNFHFGGRNADYVERRLQQFLQLVAVAIQHEKSVYFG